jgi:hypothetical protein
LNNHTVKRVPQFSDSRPMVQAATKESVKTIPRADLLMVCIYTNAF